MGGAGQVQHCSSTAAALQQHQHRFDPQWHALRASSIHVAETFVVYMHEFITSAKLKAYTRVAGLF